MALIAHMKIEGSTQGLISEKCSQQSGREDTVRVFELVHAVEVPRDAQSGRTIGQRLHRPLVIRKELDRSSPMIEQAMIRAESLDISIQFYRFDPSGTGVEEHFYTIVLERAQFISYTAELPFVKDAEKAQYPLLETVSIAYERITATYEPDGITMEDDWRSPVT